MAWGRKSRGSRWGWYPQSGPRRKVTDGIKAKSAKGAIGDTWWSKRFITLLESYGWDNRLARGRSYARSGQVMNLDLTPGNVLSKVQGSAREPYAIEISLGVFSDEQWAKVAEAMAGQALFLAKLLNGEMPQEIEQAFETAGLTLFPISSGDLEMFCSCPDYAVPCKHLAAVLYLLAERFDEDPFQVFAWRGMGKEALLERLRQLRQDLREGPAGSVEETHPEEPEFTPLEVDPIAFWRMKGPTDAPATAIQAAATPDLMIRRLGSPPPTLAQEAVEYRLRTLYTRLTQAAEQLAYRDPLAWDGANLEPGPQAPAPRKRGQALAKVAALASQWEKRPSRFELEPDDAARVGK